MEIKSDALKLIYITPFLFTFGCVPLMVVNCIVLNPLCLSCLIFLDHATGKEPDDNLEY